MISAVALWPVKIFWISVVAPVKLLTQLALLGARHVYALDVTKALLDATLPRAELDTIADCVQTVCGMVQDVEPRPLDIVIAFAVLQHCFPLEHVMPGLLRWLKPGCLFVAVKPISYVAGLEWLRNHSGFREMG